MVDFAFFTLRGLLIWLGAWSLVGFILMGEDKNLAQTQRRMPRPDRISERTIHEVALIGGFVGVILGAKVFAHKTSKPSFWPPIGASIVLWLILLFALGENGLLRVAA